MLANNQYDEICRMIGDVSVRSQSFSDEILIYAKHHGYNANNKRDIEYERIFEDDNNTIKVLANKRNAFIHETVPVVYGGLMEEYLSKSYEDIKKLYDDFVKYYDEHCSPLIAVIDEGWYKKTPEEITKLEEAKEKGWIEFMSQGYDQ